MPTYEYQCLACSHHFEAFQRISDDPIRVCPKCNQEQAKRLISASAFHLKGTGWYKTDYANGKSSTNGTHNKSSDTPKSTESTPSTTSAATPDSGSCPSGGCKSGTCSSDD